MEVKITSVKDLPPGKMLGFESQDKAILVANIDGNYYAIGNICMHEGCTLSEGTLIDEKIICPCHGLTYDVRTGAVLKEPAEKPEPAFKLKVDGGQIFLVA
jgi:nitrite reductase/ring-hydroxylating ferredoxin subunit